MYPINCAEQILQCCRAICLPIEAVRALFPDREQHEDCYNYSEGRIDIALEVRIDPATFSFLFSPQHVCDAVFLFLDRDADIVCYTEYCDIAYPYDIVRKGWLAGDLLIQINEGEEEYNLLILPLEPPK